MSGKADIESRQYGAFGDIHGIFMRSVEDHPRRPALEAGGRLWTYHQLSEAVKRAAFLINSCIGESGRRLALVGANHPAYVIAYLAAQKLGVVTVEISPDEPVAVLRDLLHRSDCGLVLTDRDSLLELEQPRRDVLLFDDFLGGRVNREMMVLPERVPHPLPPSQLASIVFTSGSTGEPKGVQLSQGNFDFVTSAVIDYLGLRHNDRYAMILPLYHTYGKSVLLSSLGSGACLVLLDNFQNIPAFLRSLRGRCCTALSVVPFHLEMLRKFAPRDLELPDLRVVTSSGNKLSLETARWLKRELPKASIFSMYGLTESTTRACYLPPERLLKTPESCGVPLPGVELKIVGLDEVEVPIGAEGEVLIKGPNVMLGYFDDPVLSAATLKDGWLRTGDLGWLNLRGQLTLSGRMKEIIKCAGERISMREIEGVLRDHVMVADAAVIGMPHPVLGEIAHAFIETEDPDLDLDEIKSHCARRLSHHKLPRGYTIVAKLPRTTTGKVRKFMLEAQE